MPTREARARNAPRRNALHDKNATVRKISVSNTLAGAPRGLLHRSVPAVPPPSAAPAAAPAAASVAAIPAVSVIPSVAAVTAEAPAPPEEGVERGAAEQPAPEAAPAPARCRRGPTPVRVEGRGVSD